MHVLLLFLGVKGGRGCFRVGVPKQPKKGPGHEYGNQTLQLISHCEGGVQLRDTGADDLVHEQPFEGLPVRECPGSDMDRPDDGTFKRGVLPWLHSGHLLSSPVIEKIAASMAASSLLKSVVQPVSGARGRSGRSVIRQLLCDSSASWTSSRVWRTLISDPLPLPCGLKGGQLGVLDPVHFAPLLLGGAALGLAGFRGFGELGFEGGVGMRRSSNIGPVNVGAEFLASHGPSGKFFSRRAVFGWKGAFAVTPEAGGLNCHAEGASKFGRPPGVVDGFCNCVHSANSTLVENTFQQMQFFLFNICL